MNRRHLSGPVMLMLASSLVTSGCQSLPSSQGAGVVRAMPGELSRARYTPELSAMAALDDALSKKTVTLDGIPLDEALTARLPVSATLDGQTRADSVRRLAEETLIGDGPYRLVRADLPNGRLEYRSERTAMHLSVSVRAANEREQSAGHAYVVTDLFGQASLAELVDARSSASGSARAGMTAVGYPAITPVAQRAGATDTDRLAYFDGLPRVERDRNDLLALRALLQLRLGQDENARNSIERGIVRYPNSPLYFVLAEELFDRKGQDVPNSLTDVIVARFEAREVRESRVVVERFLATGGGV